MTQWEVSTVDKKSVEEHEIWSKDGVEIRRINGFRWGTWIVTTNDGNEPKFEYTTVPGGNDVADSVDMYNASGENIDDVELVSLDDGWYGDVVYPDDMDDDERERLEELWDEESYSGWEGDGWMQSDGECWVWGELKIEKVDYDEN